MARIRTVKPEFWEDEGIASLSREARLLYIATWNHADDEGILRWTPEFVKAQVFPYDDDIDTPAVEQLMAELQDGDFVFAYRAGRLQQRLAFVLRFHQHQRINRPQPSKFPPPSLQNPEVRRAYARRDDWRCGICGEQIAERVEDVGGMGPPKALELSIDHIVPRAEGGPDDPSNLRATHFGCNAGRRDSGTGSANDSRNDSPPEGNGTGKRNGSGSTGRGATACPDPFPITDDLRAWASERAPHVDLAAEAEKLVNWAKSKGVRRKDWPATLRNWALKSEEDHVAKNPGAQRPKPATVERCGVCSNLTIDCVCP